MQIKCVEQAPELRRTDAFAAGTEEDSLVAQGCEKTDPKGRNSEKQTSGAKAHVIFRHLSARLKPGTFTEPGLLAEVASFPTVCKAPAYLPDGFSEVCEACLLACMDLWRG